MMSFVFFEYEIDLICVFDVLCQVCWIIVLIMVVCVVVGVLYVFVVLLIYQVDLMIQIDDVIDVVLKNLFGDVVLFFNVVLFVLVEVQILLLWFVVMCVVEDLCVYIVVIFVCVLVIGVFVVCFNDGVVKFGLFGFGGYVWGQEWIDVVCFDVLMCVEGDIFQVVWFDNMCYWFIGVDMKVDVIGMIGCMEIFDMCYGLLYIDIIGFDVLFGMCFQLVC